MGEPFDALNASISAARGDWTGAGLSAASMIPVWGDAIGKGGKLGRYLAKYGDEAAAVLKSLDKANDARRAAEAARVIEKHHLLPREFADRFAKAGLNIEDYVIELERGKHRLKPDGIHTGPDNWNKRWREFFRKYPEAKREQILEFLQHLRAEFGI